MNFRFGKDVVLVAYEKYTNFFYAIPTQKAFVNAVALILSYRLKEGYWYDESRDQKFIARLREFLNSVFDPNVDMNEKYSNVCKLIMLRNDYEYECIQCESMEEIQPTPHIQTGRAVTSILKAELASLTN